MPMTIREEIVTSFSVDPDAPWPPWAASAITLLACIAIIGPAG
jgi:hypothetical protein